MRPLVKSAQPAQLQLKGAKLARDYIDAVGRKASPPQVWRKKYIREALKRECVNRCAYCDASIAHVTFGDIEHYRPRVDYPELVVEWSNLTIACDLCNSNKGDNFNEAVPLVWPYSDPIGEHFTFNGPYVWGHPGSERGRYTEAILKLNENERVERRTEVLLSARRLMDLWFRASAPLKEVFEDEIREFLQSTDYAMTAREYLRSVGYPTLS